MSSVFYDTVAARLTFYVLLQMNLFVNVGSSYQSIVRGVERANQTVRVSGHYGNKIFHRLK